MHGALFLACGHKILLFPGDSGAGFRCRVVAGRQPHNLKRELYRTNDFADNESECVVDGTVLQHHYVVTPNEYAKALNEGDQFRSTIAKKTLKEEALESLKAMTPVNKNAPPSALRALLEGLSVGSIALILYKFTTTIEASLNRQTISDNFSGKKCVYLRGRHVVEAFLNDHAVV
ncbi:hypothetical protein CTI12_AA026570 [Artemisia annua]|uniref:Uncharacterized protein n=1 Tax=Artemisia annua TaxID=35608 RepID=A0A2U1QI88_ARTAN|nr:hypothetical protein CTI12_AA026570 [Artemisia annua]